MNAEQDKPEFYHSEEDLLRALLAERVQILAEAARKGRAEFDQAFDRIFPKSSDSNPDPTTKSPA